jgi:two-component system, OmpR family, response regulator TctD
VLLLTAQEALQDRVQGLNLGADDFLTKPFALEELEACLMALVRCSRDRQSPSLQCGSLSFDIESRAFTLSGTLLPLTPREHAALAALLVRTSYPVDKTYLIRCLVRTVTPVLTPSKSCCIDCEKKLTGSDVRIVTVRGWATCWKI